MQAFSPSETSFYADFSAKGKKKKKAVFHFKLSICRKALQFYIQKPFLEPVRSRKASSTTKRRVKPMQYSAAEGASLAHL